VLGGDSPSNRWLCLKRHMGNIGYMIYIYIDRYQMDENGIYPKWWPLKVRKMMINQCVVWMHKTHTDIHIYIYAHLVFGQTQMMSIYKTHQVGIQAAENKMIWEEYTFGFRLQNVSSGVKDVWMSIQRANRIVIRSDQFFMFIDSYLDIHIYIHTHLFVCVSCVWKLPTRTRCHMDSGWEMTMYSYHRLFLRLYPHCNIVIYDI
jgi:hypothetical protein